MENIAPPPEQSRRKTINLTALRFITLALCLLTLGGAVVLPSKFLTAATAQRRAARRIALPGGKSRKPPSIRRSPDARVISPSQTNDDGTITPEQIIAYPVQITTAEIMLEQKSRTTTKAVRRMPELERPERQNLRDGPAAYPGTQWPLPSQSTLAPVKTGVVTPSAPQTLGTQFDGATGPTETAAFPPDTMGAVGPTQFFVFLNGRMRTFNKTTGIADGVINVDPDVFFASVLTTPGVNEVVFTSDPNVRYDRLSGRWFVTIIDVPLNVITDKVRANRVLIAVSDAPSSNALSAGTVWTLYQFVGDGAGTRFTDYPSLGIDAMALYIGANMFSATTGGFSNTRALIIPKAPFLTATALSVFAANNLIVTSGASPGPWSPRGVDNPDPANTGMTATGYFIGTDFGSYNTLTLRRVTNPGAVGGSPTVSANILVTTPLTTNFDFAGQPVPHLGNTVVADADGNGFPDGNLDALDDRLYAAVARNGRLWTSHNIGVASSGVATPNAAANTAQNDRVASRWYELQNLGTTPAVLQSGTVYDNAALTPRHYWIPSIAVSGQGHAALGCSIAGATERVNAFTTGRLTGDTLGTLRDGPGGIAFPGYTASVTAYNPPGDPGPNRRWGDYSFTSLDPKDDMTMWTIQEYCNGTNTYGVRAVKLIAPPPPPTNTAAPAAIQLNNPSTNIVVTGAAPAGQGFYDPGADPPAPHITFTHIAATGAGIIVNSTTFNTPTQVTLNVSTVGSTPGTKTVTITNPDGQTTTVQILVGPTAAAASISGTVQAADNSPLAGVTMRLGGSRAAVTITDAAGNYHFDNVDTDNFYTVTPSLTNYHFSPEDRSFSLLANKTDAMFTGSRDANATGNPIDSAEYFVRQHYLDFLGREPDESGFTFWSNQILACGGDAACLELRRVNVSAAYFLSIEFQETGGVVDGLYRASFARAPLYAEFIPDAAAVAQSVIVGRGDWTQQLSANKQTLIEAWVERSAFKSIYGALSNAGYVDKLIANTRVSFTTTERNALVDSLGDGSSTRASVLRRIVEDQRFVKLKFNEAFVMMEYFGYLRRDADAAGYKYWLQKLNEFHGNFVQAEMVKAFINSTEYRQRFGQ